MSRTQTDGIVVCDASVVIALLRGEDGADSVREALERVDSATLAAWISTVNLCEVHQALGPQLPEIIGAGSVIEPVAFSEEHARQAAALRDATRHAGLGIADRACLAVAKTLQLPVLTTDRVWADVDVGVDVRVIR